MEILGNGLEKSGFKMEVVHDDRMIRNPHATRWSSAADSRVSKKAFSAPLAQKTESGINARAALPGR